MTVFDEEERVRDIEAARRRFPGPDYYTALGWIHQALRPRTYLEIGVAGGESLRRALPTTSAVGVDPAWSSSAEPRVYGLTSDEFFAACTPQSVFGSTADMVFVDGCHAFPQVYRDFRHAVRWLTDGGLVVLHDCLPLDTRTANPVRQAAFYTGDVWKMIPLVVALGVDAQVAIVPNFPSGLALVTRVGHAESWPLHPAVLDEIDGLPFEESAHVTVLPRVVSLHNDEGEIRRYIETEVRPLSS